MQTKAKRKILFVSHMASRSGAPILLLEIIKEFKRESTVPFEILIIHDGEISEEFKLLGKTYTWNRKQKSIRLFFIERLVHFILKLWLKLHQLYILYSLRNFSFVFLNTITIGKIQKRLLFLKSSFICYVHEMGAAIEMATTPEDLKIVLAHTNLFLACSQAVKNNLVLNHQVSSKSIMVLNTSLPQTFRDKSAYMQSIDAFKQGNSIPEDAIIIGIAGNSEWRKGVDLFVPLIIVYFNLFPQDAPTYFVWKGFDKSSDLYYFNVFDYRKFNKSDYAILLAHDSDPMSAMACFDVHLLLSREDPYPLVVLEAASFGIPTVCFADAGGSPEFVESDCGFVVPYCDLIRMAERLHELVTNKELRTALGVNARTKLQARHGRKNAMPAFMKILEEYT
ncbi:MAG: glycosyltransferase family 4 protein [Ferruginibacter sp.]